MVNQGFVNMLFVTNPCDNHGATWHFYELILEEYFGKIIGIDYPIIVANPCPFLELQTVWL